MQAGDEPFECHGDIDLYGEFIVMSGRFDGFGVGIDHVESVFDGGEIGLADGGQFGAAGVAAKKREAHAVFEKFDLMADGGAGDAEFSGGSAERAEAGCGFEGGEGAERGEIAFGQVGSPWGLDMA